MAKLNGVKTLDMVNGEITKVEYDGAVYAKVEGEARKYDIALIVKGWGDQNKGEFYNVINDEHAFYDGDASSIYIKGAHIDASNHREYVEVFRKVTAANSPIETRVDELERRVDALEGPKGEPLKAGDYAIVQQHTSYKPVRDGQIVKLNYAEDDGFNVSEVLGGSSGWVYTDELTKVSEEEAEKVKAESEAKEAQRKLEAKWSKIGRKVNEYKRGDIVRATRGRAFGSDHEKGDIGEIITEPTHHFRVKSARCKDGALWTQACSVELITPVEARFDR